VVATANELADRSAARVTVSDDIATGVAGVDFVYTDVWVLMGEPREVWEQRLTLRPYQVNADLMERTGNPTAKFLHCLPAFHAPNTSVGTEIMNAVSMPDGLEVTDEVFESPASVVFDQAENRLHTIKAILVATLG
jgi:ornithine carbamoyltransferase